MRRNVVRPPAVLICIAVALVVSFGCVSQETSSANERRMKILYTASLNGNMAGCDCEANPRAGLLKRIAWLRSLPDRNESLLVDAGDVMDVYPDIPLTDMIVSWYARLGYDAVSVGDQDFSNGIAKLLEYGDRVPFLAGNLAICPDENSCVLFPAAGKTVERNGLKISVQAVLSPEAFLLFPGELTSKVKIADPSAAVEGFLLNAAEEKADVTVLLFHGRYEAARALIGGLSDRTGLRPDVVVVGHEQKLIGPESSDGTVFVSPGPEGNRVGILELSVGRGTVAVARSGARLFSFLDDPDDAEASREYERYEEAMRKLLRNR